MSPDSRDQLSQWASGEFAKGLAAAFEGMTGTRPESSAAALGLAPELEDGLVWKQSWNGLPGELCLAAAKAAIWTAGLEAMTAAGVNDAPPEELQSTFAETLGQACALLGRAFTQRLGREVAPAALQLTAELPPNLLWSRIEARFRAPAEFFLGVSPALLDQLAEKSTAGATAASGSALASPPAAPPSPAPPGDSKTFDLLLDVELPVSVSFGHAQVPLKDVLKLTTGSIIELSRAVVEPVDVVVNNCVIARGEVVVVEGNFGVRIQEVVSRHDRLRTLT